LYKEINQDETHPSLFDQNVAKIIPR